MINTREELINALSEAAELEHGLLAQYLFAAFSFKRREAEGITPVQQALLVDWERAILQVAHQEMYHLASVCNLLSSIGGAPQFARPNFPQPMQSYYPFDFQLERFGDAALFRFIVFELPEGETPPPPPKFATAGLTRAEAAPDPLIYNHVGELYKQISEGFTRVSEAELFIGPKPFQDVEDWGLRLQLQVVKDLSTARAAIESIVYEGEGAPGKREGSHYDRFLQLREALQDARQANPGFEPARPVVTNPQTRPLRNAERGVLIKHEVTLPMAELFNDIYSTMLLMLIQYYSHGGESATQRAALRDACRRLMSAVIRPLAEMLTELPVQDGADGTAGPSFEIYSGLRLAPDRANRWIILHEKLRQASEEAQSLRKYEKAYSVLTRLRRVEEAMAGTLLNLTLVFGGAEQ